MRVSTALCALLLTAAGMPQNVIAGTIYAIDGPNDDIVILDTVTGSELNRFPTPEPSSGGPDGLAVTPTWLYFVNGNGSNLITRLDPDTGMLTGSFPAPETFGGTDGLAAMDDTLITLEPAADTLSRIQLSTGDALGACVTGLGAGGGLAAEAGRLFVTLGLARIVELNPESCQVIGGPFPVPGGDLAYGLAFDGQRLYVGSIVQPGIHTLDPETGEALGFIPLAYAPTGLAAAAEAAAPACRFDLDYRPGSAANILNTRSRGRVPLALYGTAALDAGNIDQSSLVLSGVPADHTAFEDVDGDGVLDLILHLRTQALVSALESEHGDLVDGALHEVELAGALMDGTMCHGADSVRIRRGAPGRNRRDPR